LQIGINYEKSGGAGLCARHAVRTGWKACATRKTFQNSSSLAFGPPTKHEKFLAGILLTLNFQDKDKKKGRGLRVASPSLKIATAVNES
jgi:hypothetical protein